MYNISYFTLINQKMVLYQNYLLYYLLIYLLYFPVLLLCRICQSWCYVFVCVSIWRCMYLFIFVDLTIISLYQRIIFMKL